jgi:hypothetical protein
MIVMPWIDKQSQKVLPERLSCRQDGVLHPTREVRAPPVSRVTTLTKMAVF